MRRCSFRLIGLSVMLFALVQVGCSRGAAQIDENGAQSKEAITNSGTGSGTAPSPGSSTAAAKSAAVAAVPFTGCNAYYPLVAGSKVSYSISKPFGQIGAVTVEVEEAKEKGKKAFTEVSKQMLTRSTTPGTQTTTRKYVCDGDKINVISNTIESKNPKGVSGQLDGKFPETATVMIGPSSLTPGATWSYKMDATIKLPDKPDKKDTFALAFEVRGIEDVTVPAGTFHTVRVGVKVNGKDSDEYYAAGIGLVRRKLSDGTTWELTDYSGLAPTDKP